MYVYGLVQLYVMATFDSSWFYNQHDMLGLVSLYDAPSLLSCLGGLVAGLELAMSARDRRFKSYSVFAVCSTSFAVTYLHVHISCAQSCATAVVKGWSRPILTA